MHFGANDVINFGVSHEQQLLVINPLKIEHNKHFIVIPARIVLYKLIKYNIII